MKRILLITCAMLCMTASLYAQDIIITKDAQKIDAKILEVSKNEIKYKESNYLDGPTFVLETTEINSIVYGNGKVVLYNQPEPQEPALVEENEEILPLTNEPANVEEETIELYLGLQGEERKIIKDYLTGYPKNIVAVKGDYSMIYDKKCRLYLDIEYDDAQLVRYSYENIGYRARGSFKEHMAEDNVYLHKQSIIQSSCEKYNTKMFNKKCKMLPISELSEPIGEQDYIMNLHIQRIDEGVGVASVMASGSTTTGGAIIYGYIEIKNAATNAVCGSLIVDRVQGVGDAREEVRIQHVIEETISNKLFSIKNKKVYK